MEGLLSWITLTSHVFYRSIEVIHVLLGLTSKRVDVTISKIKSVDRGLNVKVF